MSVAAIGFLRPPRLATARLSVPFFLIPSTLGVCFFLIWAFIGGMIFRDSQMAAQHETDSDIAILPRSLQRIPNRPHSKVKPKRQRRSNMRFAS
jgi:hypothetical protein